MDIQVDLIYDSESAFMIDYYFGGEQFLGILLMGSEHKELTSISECLYAFGDGNCQGAICFEAMGCVFFYDQFLNPSSSIWSFTICTKYYFSRLNLHDFTVSHWILAQLPTSQAPSFISKPAIAKAQHRHLPTRQSSMGLLKLIDSWILYLWQRMYRRMIVRIGRIIGYWLRKYLVGLRLYLKAGVISSGRKALRNWISNFLMWLDVILVAAKGVSTMLSRLVVLEKAQWRNLCKEQFSYQGPLRNKAPLP